MNGKAVARNTAYNLVGQGVPFAAAILCIPMLLTGLGAERFGVLALVWTVIAYSQMLSFGVAPAITKYVADKIAKGKSHDIGGIVLAGLALQVVTGLVALVILFYGAPFLCRHVFTIDEALEREAIGAFRMVALAVPAILIANALRGLLGALQRFDLINVVRAPLSVLTFAVPVWGAYAGWGLSAIVGGLTILAYFRVMLFAACAARAHPALFRDIPRIGTADLTTLMRFGGWVSVASMLAPIYINADRFFIGALVSMSAVTYYSAPFEMLTRLWAFPSSLTSALLPTISGLHSTKQETEVTNLLGHGVKYIVLIIGLICAFMIFFGDDILRLWLGPTYARHSAVVLEILAGGLFVNSAAFVPFTLMQAVGRPDITAKLHLLELPIYLASVWVLTRWWGIEGTAIAWSIRVSLDAGLLYLAAARIYAISIRSILRSEITAFTSCLGVLCLVGWAGAAAGANVGERLVIFGAGSIVIAVLFWRLLERGERQMIADRLLFRSAR